MSEERVPDAVYTLRLPKIKGNKTLKIELFQASQFENRWSINMRHSFYPTPPLNSMERSLYWRQEIYRVRRNGKWLRNKKADYYFLDWGQVCELLAVDND